MSFIYTYSMLNISPDIKIYSTFIDTVNKAKKNITNFKYIFQATNNRYGF